MEKCQEMSFMAKFLGILTSSIMKYGLKLKENCNGKVSRNVFYGEIFGNIDKQYHEIWSGFVKYRMETQQKKRDDESKKDSVEKMYHKIWSGSVKRMK